MAKTIRIGGEVERGDVMEFSDTWEKSSEMSSRRDSMKQNKNLRFCPGIYKPDGSYHDVWLKCWLETTPYKTFDELWKSGNVNFMYDRSFNDGGYKYANKRVKASV